MPTYLCHGFRWKRDMIRLFVIMDDLEDAAPDWIVSKTTSKLILECFAAKFDFLPCSPSGNQQQPEDQDVKENQNEEEAETQEEDASVPSLQDLEVEDSAPAAEAWSPVKLLEQYQPENLEVSCAPFAYVADYAMRIDLGADLEEEKAKYEAQAQEINEGGWLEKLRDALQKSERIGWYVVVCGDEERHVPVRDEYSDEEEEAEAEVAEEGSEEKEQEEEQKRADDGHLRPEMEASDAPVSREESAKPAGRHSLRHRLSTAALRRLFRKKESPVPE